MDTSKVIFSGDVDRVSSYNEVGPFDVYPMHANFISIIKKNISLYLNGKKIQDLNIDQAILKVKRDKANIFLGIETLILKEEKEISSSI